MNVSAEAARETIAKILGGIAPEANLTALDPEANLRRELDLDSIDFQNFLIRLSKELAVDIPERDMASLTTLAGCVAYVTTAGSARSASRS